MKLKHLSIMAVAMVMGTVAFAQDTIPQRDSLPPRDTITIPQKDTVTAPPEGSVAMVSNFQDTVTHPKKDTTDKPAKDSIPKKSLSYAVVMKSGQDFLKYESPVGLLMKNENTTI